MFRCENAPRDGRWILIQYDHNDDCEDWYVGRWKPEEFDGVGYYEWEYVDRDGTIDHLSDGRVCDWKPLPD